MTLATLFNDQAFTWGNLAMGIIGSIAASLLTYFATVTLKLRLPGPASWLFWRKLKSDLHVVLSELSADQDPNRAQGRRFSMAPLGDTISFSYILGHLRLIVRAAPTFASVQTHADFDRIKSSNLLVIGGPKFNLAARLLFTELDGCLRFQFKRVLAGFDQGKLSLASICQAGEADIALKQIIDRTTDPHTVFGLTEGGDIEYGLVLITRNPYNSRKIVALAAGLNQISTLAAGQVLMSLSNWDALRYLSTHDGLQLLVRCRVTDNVTATDVRVVAKQAFDLEAAP